MRAVRPAWCRPCRHVCCLSGRDLAELSGVPMPGIKSLIRRIIAKANADAVKRIAAAPTVAAGASEAVGVEALVQAVRKEDAKVTIEVAPRLKVGPPPFDSSAACRLLLHSVPSSCHWPTCRSRASRRQIRPTSWRPSRRRQSRTRWLHLSLTWISQSSCLAGWLRT